MKKLLTFIALISFTGCLNAQIKQAAGKNTGRSFQSAVNAKLIGSWEVWIPGAVTYSATETAVYRTYSPGAAMNRLTIERDGSYQWGNKKGRLVEVRPWHAQEGRRYYQISDMKGNEYDFWYDESKDNLVVLFGEVGGHAATGSRLNGKAGQIASPEKKETMVPVKPEDKKNETGKSSKSFKIGEKVEIEWKGLWYKGIVLQVNKDIYKVSYDGWGSIYDEWVAASRIRGIK